MRPSIYNAQQDAKKGKKSDRRGKDRKARSAS